MPAVSPGCEVLVRRAFWIVPLLLVLLVLSRRPDVPRDMTPLALHLSERFGRTNLDYITHRGQHRLELLLTDKRWHGLNDVVPDSAKAIARYALADLKGFPRPDTIVVTIRTAYNWGGMVHGESGVRVPTEEP